MTPMPKGFLDFVLRRVGPDKYEKFSTYDPHKKYIGPENNPELSKIAPEKFGDCSMSPAGWAHDNLHALGGTESDRKFSDDVFLACMQWLIAHHRPAGIWRSLAWYWKGRKLALVAANGYYLAVRVGGKSSFNYHD